METMWRPYGDARAMVLKIMEQEPQVVHVD
jgi:hypothetical protein